MKRVFIIWHNPLSSKKIKKGKEHFSSKTVVSNIQKQAGGVFEINTPFAVAPDRIQIYNAAETLINQNIETPRNQLLSTLGN